ncbi:hypothetical protein, conserved [Babesia bigemina]|uniref:C3H1-type domain-containing protein n=1 Tax=Babesia bigemina TaxID=5866 RepID=A0A061BS74_BABBI|nr:hypothetical protein, conserved [Babesia bigemina]CDR71406.1 hypothetical protein, conserved [Babesia bigemina]|eukprot:XP_012770356.1 hypothetical protein, conserved [Babesia bigemina]
MDRQIKEAKDAKNSVHPKTQIPITELEKQKQRCQNNHTYYRDGSKQKAYEDIEERQKQLEDLKSKLTKFTEELNKDGNNNILTHLCDGLQTFLGFDSDTKGYTGQGIVYSDLDRLCDAVMGFLSGVLKDVSEKQPYKVGKDILENIVTDFESKLSTGRKGFEVIETVAQRVREYNDTVSERSSEVRKKITDLDDEMTTIQDQIKKTYPTKEEKDAEPLADKIEKSKIEVTEMVEKCKKLAKTFKADLFNLKDKIKDLGHEANEQINKARDNVEREGQRLGRVQKNEKEQYEEMETKITSVLLVVKDKLNQEIRSQVNGLISLLNEKVKNILKECRHICRTLENYLLDLDKWMETAKTFIDNVIEKQVGAIKKEVDEAAKDRKPNHKKNLDTSISELEAGLKQRVTELDTWNKAAGSAVSAAKEKCKTIGDMVETKSAGSDKIHGLAKTMQEKADKLREAAKEVKKEIGQWVKAALTQVKEMDGKLKHDLGKLKEQINQKIGDYVRGYIKEVRSKVKSIEGDTRNPKSGLWGVKQKVKDYAETYKKFYQKNTGMVYQWIEQILESGAVDSYLTHYGTTERQNAKNKVKEKIAEVAETEVDTQPKAEGNVKATLNNIKDFLTNFAERVKIKLAGGEFTKFVDSVRKDTGIVMSEKSHLEAAVKIILRLVATAASKLANEINELALKQDKDSLGQYLDDALDVAGTLEQNLGDAFQSTNDHVGNVTSPALNDNIPKLIIAILNGELPAAKGDKVGEQVTLKNVKGFSQYNAYINQQNLNLTDPRAALTGVDDDTEGTLPAAIGDIERQVTSKLTAGDLASEIDKSTTFQSPFDQITTKLKEIAGLVDSATKTTTKVQGGQDSNDGIQQYLGALDEMRTGGGTVNLTAKGLESHAPVKGLETIKNDIGLLQTKNIENVKHNLNELCAAVRWAANEVNWFMREMKKGQIDEKLAGIRKQIDDLRVKEIQGTITLCTDFLQKATESGQVTIKALEKYVDEQVADAIKTLTTQAKKHYVSTLKTELQNFTARVQGHLTGLTTLIDKDLTIGYKGLMKTVQGVKFIVEHKKEAEFYTSGGTKLFDAIKNAVPPPPEQERPTKEHFKALVDAFEHYFNNIHGYVKEEISRLDKQYKQTLNYQLTHTESKYLEKLYTSRLNAAHTAINNLLDHINTSHRYNHELPALLDSLSSATATLAPESFARTTTPLLDGIGKGVEGFVSELEKAYNNRYDGGSDGIILVDARTTKVTDDGKKCAKVCLNVLSILYTELNTLVKHCQSSSRSEQINKLTNVGKFFLDQGYDVSDDGEQNGELQDDKRMTVFFIYKRLFGYDDNHIYKKDRFNQEIGPLKTLHDCLQTYYQVGHVATSSSKKTPCSIFEMLCWLSGLPCNTVYTELWRDAVSDLFVDPKKQTTEDDISMSFVSDEPLPAYPTSIECDAAQRAVKRLCSRSYDVLIKIVGYGNEHTTYAVDYCDNSLRLSYPSDPSQCLELLLDILRRLLPVFRFLHSQCKLETKHYGWSNCLYGKDILTGKSHCDKHPDDKQTDCLPRSPLQSYLSDTLPGHLPHNLTTMGCKSVCSNCPKGLPGQPCLTPLGFRGFSGSTKQGKELCKVLTKFLDNSNINTLFGLLPKPPSTLPEHFQFALSLANMLKNDGSRTNDVKTAFDKSINEVSIDLHKNSSKLTSALRNVYLNDHSHEGNAHHKANEADLYTLSKTTSCIQPNDMNIHCGPYLSSTCFDTYNYLAEKHSDLYLSWAVYLPWTFYNYLKSLLDAFQQIDCVNFGCTRCHCKPGGHGKEYNCKCNALVTCRGVISTFYSYGFTFGSASQLMHTDSRRYCRNFYNQICNVLKSQHFTKLFEECDNFIWTIREPFTYLVLALWSLSLFYLICVMIGRLDVLHIRSHLRIPSSHKITAQSLLAAAQVGRLAKISYLQP